MTFGIDGARRLVSIDPRDPAFFQDPNPAYGAILRTAPVFLWEAYGFWCFATHRDVTALLRDKRFGRCIETEAPKETAPLPDGKAHLHPFVALERHSLLELEPPAHTRLRALVNRAFVSR